MYQCSMCNGSKDGEPAMRNGALGRNLFCDKCKKEIMRRQAESRAENRQEGICMWCGDPYVNPDDPSDHVCDICKVNRDWILKCGRYSGTVVRYVKNREKEWEEHRETLLSVEPVVKPKEMHNESDDRIAKLEQMMTALCKSLGL